MSKTSEFANLLVEYPSEVMDGIAAQRVFQEIEERLNALESILKKISSDFAVASTKSGD